MSRVQSAIDNIFKGHRRELAHVRDVIHHPDVSNFLVLCTKTASWINGRESRKEMCNGLRQIILRCASSSSFQDKILGFIDQATTSCEDRASYYFILMQLANLEPERPLNSLSSKEIYEYARVRAITQFLTDQADSFIKREERIGVRIDPIEEYLAFIALAPKLGINISGIAMRYADYSGARRNSAVLSDALNAAQREMHSLTIRFMATSGDFHQVYFLKDHISKVEDKYADMDYMELLKPATKIARLEELSTAIQFGLNQQERLERESASRARTLTSAGVVAAGAGVPSRSRPTGPSSADIAEERRRYEQFRRANEERDLEMALAISAMEAEERRLEEARQEEARMIEAMLEDARRAEARRIAELERRAEQKRQAKAVEEARKAEARRVAEQERQAKAVEEARVIRAKEKSDNLKTIASDFKRAFKANSKNLALLKIRKKPSYKIIDEAIVIYDIEMLLPVTIGHLEANYVDTPRACLTLRITDDRGFKSGGVQALTEYFNNAAQIVKDRLAAEEEAKLAQKRADEARRAELKEQQRLAKEAEKAEKARKKAAEKLAKERASAEKAAKAKAEKEARKAHKEAVKRAKLESIQARKDYEASIVEGRPFYGAAVKVNEIIKKNPTLQEHNYHIHYDTSVRPNLLSLSSNSRNPRDITGLKLVNQYAHQARGVYDVYQVEDVKAFTKKGSKELAKFAG